jgi:hypothetical protein
MTHATRLGSARRRRLGAAFAAALLLGAAGCHSIDPAGPDLREHVTCCSELARPCRNHVYVFLVHGMDPLDFANLSGVRDYIQSLGFIKTYYGQLYHTWYFERELKRIHEEDPLARFVLIGFSFGANMVRDVARDAKKDGITIDLLVYLGGNTLENRPEDRPDNALKIVNILASGCIWNGDTLDGALNLHYSDVWHFGSPSHHHTLKVLAEELSVVADRVPLIVETVAHSVPAGPEEVPPPKDAARDEWDFLKPDGLSGGYPAVHAKPVDQSLRPAH